jgi:hypothetical protein
LRRGFEPVSLWDTFETLPRPSAPSYYTVQHGKGRFRVGRSYDNHPTILIEFAEPVAMSAPRRLATLTYSPPVTVDVAGIDGTHRTENLAVLQCRTDDPELGTYFFRIASAILLDSPQASTEMGFEKALDTLVTLFRSLARPGVKTIEGLWAELAIILWAMDPVAAMSSWHSSPRALHDFAAGSYRLEVKASLKGLREHAVRLDQLAAVGEGSTLIASMLLDELDSGDSVIDLVEAVGARVGSDSVARLQTIVGDSLGNRWRDAPEMKFSLENARASLRLYAAEDIPTIPEPIPPQVKDVSFTVDLSGTRYLEFAAARALGDLFRQILPSRT